MSFQKDNRRSDRFKKSKSYLTKHPHKGKKSDKYREHHHDNTQTDTPSRDELKEIAINTFNYWDDSTLNIKCFYYPEEKNISLDTKEFISYNTNFIFECIDIYDHIKNNQYDYCSYLIYGSPNRAGGGYMKGSIAQEEMVSYHTNLAYTLTDSEYSESYKRNSKDKNNYIYSSDLCFLDIYLFREKFGDIFQDESQFIKKQAIIGTAINYKHFNPYNEKVKEEQYIEIMTERINRVLSLSLKNGNYNIVLGPWGCGVFSGDINILMTIIKKNPLLNYFQNIIFISTDEETVNIMKSYF